MSQSAPYDSTNPPASKDTHHPMAPQQPIPPAKSPLLRALAGTFDAVRPLLTPTTPAGAATPGGLPGDARLTFLLVASAVVVGQLTVVLLVALVYLDALLVRAFISEVAAGVALSSSSSPSLLPA